MRMSTVKFPDMFVSLGEVGDIHLLDRLIAASCGAVDTRIELHAVIIGVGRRH